VVQKGETPLKRAIFLTMVALGLASLALAQDASKFNGTWKGDGGQVRKLNLKDGVVFMEETQTSGSIILRQYPTQGQEITMTEGVWKGSKATGKMDGNKLVVETTMPNGTQWHDEWTMADDGKTYSALRLNVTPGGGGGFGGGRGPGGPPPAGAGAGAPPAGGPPPAAGAAPGGGAPRGGGGRGRGGPETFTKID
jgi:hypothetical protein